MRLIALSDSHGYHENYRIPEGDIFIFAGDFCNYSNLQETVNFATWFKKLPHKYKILTVGNHDMYAEKALGVTRTFFENEKTYLLIDEAIEIEGRLFYGSPWVPVCGTWGWMKQSNDLKKVWAKIPLETEILITHGPPYKTLDNVYGEHIGCKHLRDRVKVVIPKVHIFGHCHEQGGKSIYDGITRFYNVSSKISCTEINL